jgi:DNA polymerase
VPSAETRRAELEALHQRASVCVRCPQLVAARQNVVVGAGDPDADVMFVGEAPGANEDRSGLPFVGQAGQLLDRLLEGIGLEREDVFVANVLKCRPPGNRDPLPVEIANCQDWLMRQVELVQPRVVCTLGNFATKLLRGEPTGITRIHGRPEVRVIGERAVRLYPLFHPAAALYTPANVELLRADFARIPELLAMEAPAVPAPEAAPAPAVQEPAVALAAPEVPVVTEPEPVLAAEPEPGPPPPEPEPVAPPAPAALDGQLELF